MDACFDACVGWKEYRCVTLSYRQHDSGDGGFGGNGDSQSGGGNVEMRGRVEKEGRGRGRDDGGGGKVVINGGQCSLSATHYADLNASSVTPDSLADLYSSQSLSLYHQ